MKTIQEMIEVMQAYEQGEEIEYRDNGEWVATDDPAWSWNNTDYRVKPNKKYQVGMKFVDKDFENIPNPEIFKLTSVDGVIKRYRFSNGEEADELKMERKFISVSDVLWYWEYKLGDEWLMLIDAGRCDRAKAKDVSGAKDIKPLYALGFRLKD